MLERLKESVNNHNKLVRIECSSFFLNFHDGHTWKGVTDFHNLPPPLKEDVQLSTGGQRISKYYPFLKKICHFYRKTKK